MNKNDLTIVVITYNRRQLLEKFYKTYKDILDDLYPLLVIDGSDWSQRFDFSSFINVINTHNRSLSHNLNYAILFSKTRYVMICNDDIEFKSTIKNGIKLIKPMGITQFCVFSCFVIDKSIIPKVGWFDMRLLDAGYDGSDYCIRMKIMDIQRIELNKKSEYGYHYFVKHNKFERNNKYPEWKYINSHKFYYKKWSLNTRTEFKCLNSKQLTKRRKLADIDWFPYHTKLYDNGIWSDEFKNDERQKLGKL